MITDLIIDIYESECVVILIDNFNVIW